MKNPSISVVLPLYNHAHYIAETLQSVLEQTSEVDEIILIDDGSTDNGFSVACDMLGNEPRATLLQQENCGAENTLNRAIELSQSEFIAVLNSDDLFAPTKIERCRKILCDHPEIDFISGGIDIIDGKGERLRGGETVEWLQRATEFQKKCRTLDQAFLNENFAISTSNMVFSRELWRNCQGFQPLRYCHDLDFLLTALCDHGVMIDREERHIFYRVHKSNTIKENLLQVRLEVAAVMANAMQTNRSRLLDAEHLSFDLRLIAEIVASKNNGALLSALQVLRNNCSDRHDFYTLIKNQKSSESLIRNYM